jgi:hypothetical protein
MEWSGVGEDGDGETATERRRRRDGDGETATSMDAYLVEAVYAHGPHVLFFRTSTLR